MISPRFQLDPIAFLRDHWQRKPLLIKAALPEFTSPISPDELGGLAMEEDADSRIVSCHGSQWSLEQGPFKESDFKRDGLWSLLVQRVDEWYPEVAALRGCVDFIPNWRFDDIMVSFATDGAGVGPHYDHYDVFLLQGMGQRRWRVGPKCDPNTPILESSQLRLIDAFEPEATYVLSPGDALYIPPGYAHWGDAIGESMTFSLGFRAPRVCDLVARLSDTVIEQLNEVLLLEDRGSITTTSRPGEVTRQHIDTAREAVLNCINALGDVEDWYPELLSELSDPPVHQDEPVGPAIQLTPSQRLVWQETVGGIAAYLGGSRYELMKNDVALLMQLSAGESVATDALDQHQTDIVERWWALGFLEAPLISEAH